MEDTFSARSGGTSVSTGTKRKRQSEPKFYAVRVGHTPGVYYTWADCLEQVKGFKKATYKSFSSLTDAERFVAGEEPSSSTPSALKYYAVRSGKVPGIYNDWTTAQAQIIGWQKPKHRCFSTRAEAQRFLDGSDGNTDGGSENHTELLPSFFTSHAPITADEPLAETPPKKAKKTPNGTKAIKLDEPVYNEADFEPGTGPLPPGAEDGFDPNIVLDPVSGKLIYKTQEQREATKKAPGTGSVTGPIRIHTDGSSLGNGKKGAMAGVGVYFGPRDKRNVSEALTGPRQTNQRAELTAIFRALEIVPRNRDVIIISDSKYAIDCVTVWFINWRRNGWKNANGKAVENKDIVENVLAKIEERTRLRVRTDFEWIKGHSGADGNEGADRLAVEGARKASASLEGS